METKRANEWVVTEKLGDGGLKNKPNADSSKPKESTRFKRFKER